MEIWKAPSKFTSNLLFIFQFSIFFCIPNRVFSSINLSHGQIFFFLFATYFPLFPLFFQLGRLWRWTMTTRKHRSFSSISRRFTRRWESIVIFIFPIGHVDSLFLFSLLAALRVTCTLNIFFATMNLKFLTLRTLYFFFQVRWSARVLCESERCATERPRYYILPRICN